MNRKHRKLRKVVVPRALALTSIGGFTAALLALATGGGAMPGLVVAVVAGTAFLELQPKEA